MSADNWAICPKCEANDEIELENEAKWLEENYGKVDADNWLAARERHHAHQNLPTENTLREDYDIGVWDGEFHVNYRGRCTKCGYTLKYVYGVKADAIEVKP